MVSMIDTLKKIEALIDQNKILERRNEELRNIIEINLNQASSENPETFSTFVDMTEVENLLLKFYQYNKVAVALVDREGKLIFSVGIKPICVEFFHCDQYIKEICCKYGKWNDKDNAGKVYQERSCHKGINFLILPVIVRSTHIGTIVISQFLKESDSIDRLSVFLAKSGNESKRILLKKELASLSIISENKMEALICNAGFLAEMVSYLCKKNKEFYQNFQQQTDKS